MKELRLDKLRKQLERFEQRTERAASRLLLETGRSWYFAILGLTTEVETFDFESIAQLQRVVEPPGEVELAAALHESYLFGAIGRYSANIRYELKVPAEEPSTDQRAFNRAWWIVSALRTRTRAELLIPAVCDHSWSTIAAKTDQSCRAHLIEDVPQAHSLAEPKVISDADLKWVLSNLVAFVRLLELPNFRLAVEAITTHHHQTSARMMLAQLWSGIEALFGIQAELRFRLAVMIATVIEARGIPRRDVYRRVKHLYDVRSKAIHGTAMLDEDLNQQVVEVRELLSGILCTFVEAGHVATQEEIEEWLLS